MADEIVNRIANSKLVTFDLEDHYPEGKRIQFDIKDWLYEGLVLREKDFRTSVKEHNWSQYEGHFVALTCGTDAIIPAWAYMLVVASVESYSRNVVVGSLEDLETSIYQDIINNLDMSYLKDKPVIIKGCTNKPVPLNAYIQLTSKLKTIAKSVMYGEACSSVPLYKR